MLRVNEWCTLHMLPLSCRCVYEGVMSHVNVSRHMWMSHVTYECVMLRVNECLHVLLLSCRCVYEWVMSPMTTHSYVTWLIDMWHDIWVMARVWLIHIWPDPLICDMIYRSWHVYDWVISSCQSFPVTAAAMCIDEPYMESRNLHVWHDSVISSHGLLLLCMYVLWMSHGTYRTESFHHVSHVESWAAVVCMVEGRNTYRCVAVQQNMNMPRDMNAHICVAYVTAHQWVVHSYVTCLSHTWHKWVVYSYAKCLIHTWRKWVVCLCCTNESCIHMWNASFILDTNESCIHVWYASFIRDTDKITGLFCKRDL